MLLGLGANLGDPVRQLAEALARLEPLIGAARVSSVYRTEPVGHPEQPDFFNLVCAGSALLPPHALLRATHAIEREMGRTRSFANAPRTLDIDLLAYGQEVISTPELTLPHPRLHERAFVLEPLAEIAPGWRHPLLRLTPPELLARGSGWERVERWGALPR